MMISSRQPDHIFNIFNFNIIHETSKIEFSDTEMSWKVISESRGGNIKCGVCGIRAFIDILTIK